MRVRLFGVVLLTAGAMMLFFCGLFLSEYAVMSEPAIPQSLPEEVTSLLSQPDWGLLDQPFDSQFDRGRIISYSSNPTEISFRFSEDISSLEGHWFGRESLFTTDGALVGKFDGRPDNEQDTWGDRITSHQTIDEKGIEPVTRASLPIGAEHLHKYVDLTVTMVAVYPVASGGGFFDKKTSLKERTRLFVVSPEEMRYARQYVAWADKNKPLLVALGSLAALVLGVAPMVIGLCYIIAGPRFAQRIKRRLDAPLRGGSR